ncbi:hypothetical protein T4D_11610 [Trichinella pseudospiralis]|uniref:Uncharacterized protein n=1 Tax=Trichinella pseudospiralis TaxID=6337 RepID=A0A0V1F4L5_TRIPS|nr:hypothetical protein T4D_11610 [Trichinella pseudospiralis]
MRAGSSTTSLATGRVISEVEVRIRVALLTPSRPGNSWITTPRGQRVRGRLSSSISTKSSILGPTPLFLHLLRGRSEAR